MSTCTPPDDSMSRRLQITLTDRQYAWLMAEADRTSVPAAELTRRALEQTYPIDSLPAGSDGFEVNFGIRRRPLSTGWRAGKRLD
jgi:hypothetical protein